MSNNKIECRDLKTSVKIKYDKQGSGIIFLPEESSVFAYILTAKHNFFDLNKPISVDEIKKDDISIEYKEHRSSDPIKMKCYDIFLSEADLALIILKIEDINESLLSLIPMYSILNTNKFSHCVFKGYPKLGNGYTKCLEANFHDEIEKNIFSIKCTPLDSSDYSELETTKGFSGSGLITGFNNKPTLVGIIIKVASIFNEIECIDLSKEFSTINQWLREKDYTEIDVLESESIELSKSNEIETLKSYQTNLTTNLNITDQHKEIIEKLESYDIEGAKSLLDDISEPSGETYRLKALVALTDKDISLAFSHIENAKNKEVVPNDLEFVKGLVYYFSSIDESGYKKISPYPIDRLYIKRDRISQENILKAQEIFLELSCKNENTDYDVWYLASLHLTDLKKTEEKVKELSEKNPSNYGVITYTTAFDFDVDLSTSIKKLEEIENKSINNIIDLVNCYNHQKLFDKTIILLEEKKDKFEDIELLEKCYINTYMLNKKFDEALELIKQSTNESIQNLETTIIVENFYITAQWDELIHFYEKDLTIENLYNICKVKAIQNDWDYISEKVDELLEGLQLYEVLDLAITAKFNTKHYPDVPDLLEKYSYLYIDLNDKFKRIKARCAIYLGDPLDSIKLLESIKEKETSDFIDLIDLNKKIGNDIEASSYAFEFFKKNEKELGIQDQLRLGNMIKDENPIVAKEIYRNALSSGIPDEMKPSLLIESMGMDNDKLFKEIVDGPYVKMIKLDDKIMNAIEEDQKRRILDYKKKQFSYHVLDNQRFLMDVLEGKESDIFFIRAGNKVKFEKIDDSIENIYCDISSLVLMHFLDIFELLIQRYTFYIPNNIFNYFKLSKVDNGVKETINDNIKNKKILFTEALDDEDLKDINISNLLEIGLRSLMKTNVKENSILLFDDRFINNFSQTDKATNIFSVNDLLFTLLETNIITKEVYYQCLLKLKEKGLLFISFHEDELIYHLLNAPIEDNNLMETIELSILRKYFAKSILNLENLSIKDAKNQELSEVYLFTNMYRVIQNVYYELWNIDNEKWDIYVNYLQENFYIINLGYFLKDAVESLNEKMFLSLNLSSLLYIGLVMTNTEQEKYINKIEDRFLSTMIYPYPTLFEDFILALKQHFLDKYVYDEKDEGVFLTLQSDIIKKFPFKVRDRLIADDEIRNKFDFIRPMQFWDKTVSFDEILLKIDNVLNLAKKESIEGFSIYFEDDKILIENSNLPEIRNFSDDFFMLSNNKTLRRNILEKNKEWIDCKKSRKRAIIKDIQVTTNAIERFKKFEQYTKLAAEPYYKALFEESNKKSTIDFNLIVPESIELVSNYFRFELIDNFEKNRKISTKELFKDNTLSSSLHRIFALPQELPQEVYLKVSALSSKKQIELFKEYKKTAATPLNVFHLIRLINESAKNKKYAGRVIKKILERFSKNALVEIKSYLTVYKYMYGEFKTKFKDIEETLLYILTWGHTDRIFRNFLALGIDLKQLEDIFNSKVTIDAISVFDFEFQKNILHPEEINNISFLFKGLNYSLNNKEFDLSVYKKYTLNQNMGEKYPSLELFKDYSLLKNPSNSFMSRNYDSFFNNIYKDDSDICSDEYILKFVKKTLDDLEKDIEKVELFNILKICLSNSCIYEVYREQLMNLMLKVNFSKVKIDNIITLIHFMSHQNIYLKNAELNKKIQEFVIKKISEGNSNDIINYSDCLLFISINNGSKIIDRINYFCNLLHTVLNDLNKRNIIIILSNLQMSLPIEYSKEIIELLVDLRSHE